MLLFFEMYFDFDAVFCRCYCFLKRILILMQFFADAIVFLPREVGASKSCGEGIFGELSRFGLFEL